MARGIDDTFRGADWSDNTRPFDTTSRFFRQDREDRPVFRPMPNPTPRSPRPQNRQYDRYFPRAARR